MIKNKDDIIKMRVYKKDKERIKAILKEDETMTSFIMEAALKVTEKRELANEFEDKINIKSISTEKKLAEVKNKMNQKRETYKNKWYKKLLHKK